ncbi:MAG TPA: ABC transporter permease [bacterium]|nr:ABC transporter permease [bacterium]
MSLNLKYAFREGYRGLSRARVATVITVSTVAVTLTLAGLFFFLMVNIGQTLGNLRSRIYLEAFLNDGLAAEAVRSLEEKIRRDSAVESILYISKEAALQRFQEEFGEDIQELIGENPLPASLQIRIHTQKGSVEEIEKIAAAVQIMDGVDEVVYHKNLIRLVREYGLIILAVGLGLFILLLFSSVFLIANTIRLTIHAQTRNIEVMKLVGATKAFIRRPYLIQGFLEGGIGGAIATGILLIAHVFLKSRFPGLFTFSLPVWPLPLVFSLFLGYAGSRWALKYFFKS